MPKFLEHGDCRRQLGGTAERAVDQHERRHLDHRLTQRLVLTSGQIWHRRTPVRLAQLARLLRWPLEA